MKIYDALKKDHQEVRELLSELVTLSETDQERRHDLVSEIRDALVPHSRAEESIFYNSMRSLEEGKEHVMHGYKEHMQAEVLLRTLQVMDKIDSHWRETANELKTALEHHIAEEEGEMFSVAQRLFTDSEAEMMGQAFEQLKPEIKEEGIIGTTVDMIVNLMPPRFTDSFKRSAQNQVRH